MDLIQGQNLFEAIKNITGHLSLESEMSQIIDAVMIDNDFQDKIQKIKNESYQNGWVDGSNYNYQQGQSEEIL